PAGVPQGLDQGGHDLGGFRRPRPQFPDGLPPLHDLALLELAEPVVGRARAAACPEQRGETQCYPRPHESPPSAGVIVVLAYFCRRWRSVIVAGDGLATRAR